jgi:hypothetical protein
VRTIRRRWLRLVRVWRGTFGLLRVFSHSALNRSEDGPSLARRPTVGASCRRWAPSFDEVRCGPPSREESSGDPKVSLGKTPSSLRSKRQIGCDLGRPSASGEGDDAEGAGAEQRETGRLRAGSGWSLRSDGEGEVKRWWRGRLRGAHGTGI